jgi:drug/metabolite transporter (DMT)-like permease
MLCSIPVFAVVFAYLLLHETLSLQLFGGGAIIVAGIAVIATERLYETIG